MHAIEPYYQWRDFYTSDEDVRSPFYGREYSEFEYSNNIFGYYIHPQWDDIGSQTLYIKVIYADYDDAYVIIELIGEWNDCIQNDIMTLKRDVIDVFIEQGIHKFILIGENILNFHASDDSYYEEWFDDIADDGWIVLLNFRQHVVEEFVHHRLDHFMLMGGKFNTVDWRTFNPQQLFQRMDQAVTKKIGN